MPTVFKFHLPWLYSSDTLAYKRMLTYSLVFVVLFQTAKGWQKDAVLKVKRFCLVPEELQPARIGLLETMFPGFSISLIKDNSPVNVIRAM